MEYLVTLTCAVKIDSTAPEDIWDAATKAVAEGAAVFYYEEC